MAATRFTTIAAIALAALMLAAAGCRTAEPLPEVMSEAEWDARLDELDQWRAAENEACGDDVDCKKAVMAEYMERIDALFEERLARTQARWDAQRRR